MLRRCRTHVIKTWTKFQVKYPDERIARLCIIDLPKYLHNEFINFQMEHFVKKENFRLIAGVPSSLEALDECRNIIKNSCANSLYHHIICCPEVEGKILPDILGYINGKLIRRDNLLCDITATTKELQRFYQIKSYLNDLYPVSDIMKKYGVDEAYEVTAAVNQEYGRLGIATQFGATIYKLLKANNVKMAYSWMTSEVTHKVVSKAGWVTECEIKAENVAKKYNVTLETPEYFKLMICRI